MIPGPVSVSVCQIFPRRHGPFALVFFLYIAAAAQSGSLLLNKVQAIVGVLPFSM